MLLFPPTLASHSYAPFILAFAYPFPRSLEISIKVVHPCVWIHLESRIAPVTYYTEYLSPPVQWSTQKLTPRQTSASSLAFPPMWRLAQTPQSQKAQPHSKYLTELVGRRSAWTEPKSKPGKPWQTLKHPTTSFDIDETCLLSLLHRLWLQMPGKILGYVSRNAQKRQRCFKSTLTFRGVQFRVFSEFDARSEVVSLGAEVLPV